MQKYQHALLCCLFLVSPHSDIFASETLSIADLTYLGNIDEPYAYIDNGSTTGFSVGVLHLVWEELGIKNKPDINLNRWSHVFSRLQKEPNTVLMNTSFSEERAKIFKFACPIYYEYMGIAGLSNPKKKVDLTTSGNYEKYTYGVITNSIHETTAISQLKIPPTQLYRASNFSFLIKILNSEKVDLLIGDINLFYFLWQKEGFQKELTVYKDIQKDPVCFAINHNTPDHAVEQFAAALKKVVASKRYTDLKEKYALTW